MQRPTFFTKVLKTLSQLSTYKGYSIRQIAEQIKRLGEFRSLKEIKVIVEKSLNYGVKNKLLVKKCGKFHIYPAKMHCFHFQDSSAKNKKKHVRFKRCIKKSKKKAHRKNCKTSKSRRNKKANAKSKSPRRRSVKSKKGHQDIRNIEAPSESGETADQKKHETSPSANESNSNLIVENNEKKEPLDVTPERDVHDNCVNKKRDPEKQSNVIEPPHLESETEIGWEPSRPLSRIDRKSRLKNSSKDLKRKYKRSSRLEMNLRKSLKHFIPDDKTYRKYNTRSKYNYGNYGLERSEGSSGYDCPKVKTCRKCHHHNCKGRCYHSHYNLHDCGLERKKSNTILDRFNKSNTVLGTAGESLTPFEVFLEANHNELETIIENVNEEDIIADEIEKEAKNVFETSYIN